MNRHIRNFIVLLIIGMVASFIPWGYFGALMGLPAVIINSTLITFALHNQWFD